MDRKISLSDGKYEVQHEGRGLSFWRNGEVWPAAEEYRFANVIASMYYRIIELEDRLELADRQYAGVVLALMAQGKAPATPAAVVGVQKGGMHMTVADHKGQVVTSGMTPDCQTIMALKPLAEGTPLYEHHSDGTVTFVNYEQLSLSSNEQKNRHDRALADAVWVFKKEAFAAGEGSGDAGLNKALEPAIKAYLQHWVKK